MGKRGVRTVWIIVAKTGSLWTIHKAFDSSAKAQKYQNHQKSMETRIIEMDIE